MARVEPRSQRLDLRCKQSHYEGFNIHRIQAKRAINSKGDSRGPLSEILVTNYEI
jgi:site-specific DNA-adenine methylase